MLKKIFQFTINSARTKFGILIIASIFLFSSVIIVVNIVRSNDPSDEVLSFCEEYPDAVFCTDDSFTYRDVAHDTFLTILQKYSDGIDQSFCEFYFDGKLIDYCIDTPTILFPSNFYLVTGDIYVEEIEEGLYDIYTTFTTGSPAYIFRLGMVEKDGVYHVSGLSYVDAPPTIDLRLTPTDINTFMVSMIQDSTTNSTTFCTNYFVDLALQECTENRETYQFDETVVHTFDIINIETNDYIYVVSNLSGTVRHQYRVTFIEEGSTIKISELTFKALN